MKKVIGVFLSLLLCLSIFVVPAYANQPDPPAEPLYVLYRLEGSTGFTLSGPHSSAHYDISVTGNERDYGSYITFTLTNMQYSTSNVTSGYTATAVYAGYESSDNGFVEACITCTITKNSNGLVDASTTIYLPLEPRQ